MMHRAATAYYWLILAMFGLAWHQGYAVSSIFSTQQHGPRTSGTSSHYHK